MNLLLCEGIFSIRITTNSLSSFLPAFLNNGMWSKKGWQITSRCPTWWNHWQNIQTDGMDKLLPDFVTHTCLMGTNGPIMPHIYYLDSQKKHTDVHIRSNWDPDAVHHPLPLARWSHLAVCLLSFIRRACVRSDTSAEKDRKATQTPDLAHDRSCETASAWTATSPGMRFGGALVREDIEHCW